MTRLEASLLFDVALVFALVIYGWSLQPSVAPYAPAALLVAYGVAAHYGVRAIRGDGGTIRFIVLYGLLAAVVFVPSVLI